MKLSRFFPTLAAFALSISGNASLAETQYKTAASNKIYAQTVVNEIMKKNADLLVVGLHAVVPGDKDETMIASNLDRIGKKDDADDIAVATEHKTILAPNLKESNKFEVQIPLKDANGKVIGATGLVFKYHTGADEVKLHSKAVTIRDALAKKIPSLAALFKSSVGQ
jgi:iron complex outermembrane receptor protein